MDLQAQLARYGEIHDEEQAPITAVEVRSGYQTHVPTSAEHSTSRSSRSKNGSMARPWAAAAAAILVLLLLGAIPIWLSGGGPDPAADPTPQVTTTLADTVTPPTSPEGAWPVIEPVDLDMTSTSLGTFRWTRISGDAETLPVGNIEVDLNGDGYVVHDLDDGSVWRSSDGFVWVLDDTSSQRDPADWVAPWVSDDGDGWSLPESLFPDGALIFEVDFGWVATEMPQSRHVFAISTDGESWEEVLGPPGPHTPSGEGVGSAGAVGNLLFVSVGEESGARTLWVGTLQDLDFRPPDTWPAIERTALDRSVTTIGTLSWTRVSGDAQTLPGGPIEVDASGDYLARERDGVVWRSSDGLHWARETARGDDQADTADAAAPLASEDGSSGDGATASGARSSGVFETSFGQVRISMPQSRYLIDVLTDGETWEEVSGPPGPHEPSGNGFSAAGAVGDLIWVLVVEDVGSRTLWVGKFGD